MNFVNALYACHALENEMNLNMDKRVLAYVLFESGGVSKQFRRLAGGEKGGRPFLQPQIVEERSQDVQVDSK